MGAKMNTQKPPSSEYLIHRGDALCYLYLVCNGSMEVLQDNMVVGILGKGDLVGYDVNASPLTPDHTGQFIGSNSHLTSGLAGATLGSGSGGMQQSHSMGMVGASYLPTLPSGSSAHGGAVGGMGGSLAKAVATTGGLVKSSSDLKALTYCDLKCIHIGGLLEVLKLYPEFSDTFHEEIIHDLSFNLREQHEEQPEEEEEEEEEEEDEDEEEEEGGDEEEEEEGGSGTEGGQANGREQGGPEEDAEDQRAAGQLTDEQATRYDGDHSNSDSEGDERRAGGRRGPAAEPHSDGEGHEARRPARTGQRATSATTSDEEQDPGGHRKRQPLGSLEQLARRQTASVEVAGCQLSSRAAKQGAFAARHAYTLAGGSGQQRWPEEELWHSFDALDQSASGRPGAAPPSLAARMARLSGRGRGGAEEERGASGSGSGSGRRRIAKNKSDETVLEGDELPAGEETGPAAAQGGGAQPQPARPLRSAIGWHSSSGSTGGGGNGPGGPPRAHKPPISFDLSRNTMAIVDRRRRSAGCIQRPLTITPAGTNSANAPATPGGPATSESPLANSSLARLPPVSATSGGAPARRHCHSSLIHISENEPMGAQPAPKDDSNGASSAGRPARRRPAAGQQTSGASAQWQSTATTRRNFSFERADSLGMGELAAAPEPPKWLRASSKTSYSHQDFLRIDAHITASVRRLRQEFRQELSAAIDSLARFLLERDLAAQPAFGRPDGNGPAGRRTANGVHVPLPLGTSSSEQLVDAAEAGHPPGKRGPRRRLGARRTSNAAETVAGGEQAPMSRSVSVASLAGGAAAQHAQQVRVVPSGSAHPPSGRGVSAGRAGGHGANNSPPARTASLRQLGGSQLARQHVGLAGSGSVASAECRPDAIGGSCGSACFVAAPPASGSSSVAVLGPDSKLSKSPQQHQSLPLAPSGGRPARLLLRTSSTELNSAPTNQGPQVDPRLASSSAFAQGCKPNSNPNPPEQLQSRSVTSYTIDVDEDTHQLGDEQVQGPKQEPSQRSEAKIFLDNNSNSNNNNKRPEQKAAAGAVLRQRNAPRQNDRLGAKSNELAEHQHDYERTD